MNTGIIELEGMAIHYRPGTLDRSILDCIHRHDEYALRARRFDAEDVILDVGGHAGYFALEVLLRGAGHVHVYEIGEENIELCRRNLAAFAGRVTLHRQAVWNETGRTLVFGDYPDWAGRVNTGGISLLGKGGGQTVTTVAFDEIVDQVTDGFRRRIRLLKIDAEGSEWPVLLTAKTLRYVDEIVGEYHEIGGDYDLLPPADVGLEGYRRYTRREMARCLRRAGFRVRMLTAQTRWGRFLADRRGPAWMRWLKTTASTSALAAWRNR